MSAIWRNLKKICLLIYRKIPDFSIYSTVFLKLENLQDFQAILQDFRAILQDFDAIPQDFNAIPQDFEKILQDFDAIL